MILYFFYSWQRKYRKFPSKGVSQFNSMKTYLLSALKDWLKTV